MKLLVIGGWLMLALGTAAQNCVGLNALNPSCAPPEAPHRRQFFYVGGRYVDTPNVDSTGPGRILVDQVYVERLTPQGRSQPYPVVLFHGSGGTGAQWLQTPDNRKGWASWFLERGYEVYLVDQTFAGRSSQVDPQASRLVANTVENAERSFTVPERQNSYPQSQLHTQWPGAGVVGDPTFDAFYSALVPISLNLVGGELSMRSAGCQLLGRIGPSFLVGHSIGSVPPFLISDECPDLVAGTIHLDPATIPFSSFIGTQNARPWGLTFSPVKYDPPVTNPSELSRVTVGQDTPALRSCVLQAEPARRLPNLAKVPVLILTGEASVYITYNHCVVDFLRQADVKVDWIRLSDIGIKGNGHFLHIEENNLDIAKVANGWIELQSRRRGGRKRRWVFSS